MHSNNSCWVKKIYCCTSLKPYKNEYIVVPVLNPQKNEKKIVPQEKLSSKTKMHLIIQLFLLLLNATKWDNPNLFFCKWILILIILFQWILTDYFLFVELWAPFHFQRVWFYLCSRPAKAIWERRICICALQCHWNGTPLHWAHHGTILTYCECIYLFQRTYFNDIVAHERWEYWGHQTTKDR